MSLETNTILLFFEGAERDRWVRGDRWVRRFIKDQLRAVAGRRRLFGVQSAVQRLIKGLRRAGYPVRINDRAAAERRPEYPIGLTGWPHVLDYWNLPNPAILGPGLFDHPGLAPELMEDRRYCKYIVPCAWMRDLFRSRYGDACVMWHAGIETNEWPDLSHLDKSIDLLVYDKIRWNRAAMTRAVLAPVMTILRRKGLSYQILLYDHHDQREFRRALKRSRAMIFLCEHETQGLAYQEAMACNLPVLAWDPGCWLDPLRLRFSDRMIPAQSVPFFAPCCGERFSEMAEFEAALDRFWQQLPHYQPRRYVQQNLALETSAQIYAREYFSIRGGD